MSKFELIAFANADELAQAVARKWLDEIESAKRAGQKHCVALSGGRITQKFFAEVVEQAKTRKIGGGGAPSLPTNVHFVWADERCVPPDDPESNFKLANELLFAPLEIAENQIHRIRGELPPDKAAALATAEILRIIPAPSPSPRRGEGRGEGENYLPLLDLVFLGMGEDGHVASLFPGEIEMAGSDKSIFRAVKNSPKPPPNRVTLGYTPIIVARQVWVLVSGDGKVASLRKSLYGDGQTPLGKVTQFRTQTSIFCDFKLL